MKRWKIAGICLAVAVAAAASGCGKKTGTETTAAESTAAETEEYVAESSVKLGEYKGIAVTVTEASVTDEEVENQIQQVLNSKAEYREVDRAAQTGDQVNIDYKGLLDGEAFEGGTAEGYDLTLGSGSFIDGFEDGLVGAVKGDQKDLNLTFPDPYPNNPDLAGKAVVFEVTVNAVKERSVPELTDEFVASVSPDDGTVEKYRESTRENLLEQKQLSIDNQRDTDILNAVVDNSEVVCSTASIDEAYDTQLKAYTNMLSSYGVDLATYAGMIGSDEDSFKQEIRQQKTGRRYQTLIRLGATYETLCQSAGKQITWFMGLPVLVAAVSSLFGVRALFTGILSSRTRGTVAEMMFVSAAMILLLCVIEYIYMRVVKRSSDRYLLTLMQPQREE